MRRPLGSLLWLLFSRSRESFLTSHLAPITQGDVPNFMTARSPSQMVRLAGGKTGWLLPTLLTFSFKFLYTSKTIISTWGPQFFYRLQVTIPTGHSSVRRIMADVLILTKPHALLARRLSVSSRASTASEISVSPRVSFWILCDWS